MNIWLVSAGAISLFAMGIHVVMGGREVHVPTCNSDLKPMIKGVWSVVWHFTTAVLGLNGLALILAALYPEAGEPVVLLILFQYLFLTVLFLGYSLARFRKALALPQWTIFAVICGLCAGGLWL